MWTVIGAAVLPVLLMATLTFLGSRTFLVAFFAGLNTACWLLVAR